jgi:uncharacterized MAPEG superfamily protein
MRARKVGAEVIVAFAAVALIVAVTSRGGTVSAHRWRLFEWIFLTILFVWYVFRGEEE